MKTKPTTAFRLAARAAALGLLLASAALPRLGAAERPKGTVLAEWKISQARESGADMVVPDAVGQNDLPILSGHGVSVTDAPEGSGKALLFDGSQVKQLEAPRPLDLTEGFQISFHMMAAEEGANWQTVAYFFGGFEIRYFHNRKTIGLIARLEDDSMVEIALPYRAGVWAEVSAYGKGDKIVLTVDGESETAKVPVGGRLKSMKGKATFGLGNERPYTGYLGDVTVSQPE
jgi:hypothetical protein